MKMLDGTIIATPNFRKIGRTAFISSAVQPTNIRHDATCYLAGLSTIIGWGGPNRFWLEYSVFAGGPLPRFTLVLCSAGA